MPRSPMMSAVTASSPSNRAAPNRCCSSRRFNMLALLNRVSLRGLGHQHIERGDIRVPFDECRDARQAPHRIAIERPHVVAHLSAVRVDANLAIPMAIDA